MRQRAAFSTAAQRDHEHRSTTKRSAATLYIKCPFEPAPLSQTWPAADGRSSSQNRWTRRLRDERPSRGLSLPASRALRSPSVFAASCDRGFAFGHLASRQRSPVSETTAELTPCYYNQRGHLPLATRHRTARNVNRRRNHPEMPGWRGRVVITRFSFHSSRSKEVHPYTSLLLVLQPAKRNMKLRVKKYGTRKQKPHQSSGR